MKPSVSFVLHSHLPWVLGYGRWPHGTDWLCEAVAETYLPLTAVFERLAAERIPARVVFGVTPVLAEQIAHPEFATEFRSYLAQKIEAATRDERAFSAADPTNAALARTWGAFYRNAEHAFFETHRGDLIAAWRGLEAKGIIDIATSAATHGYLPLLSLDEMVERQIAVGVATHRHRFGRAPVGIWLPECAYRPAGAWVSPFGEPHLAGLRRGVEAHLAAHGLAYFIVDSHLFQGGRPATSYMERFQVAGADGTSGGARPEAISSARLSVFEPVRIDKTNVAAFAREPRTGRQVWSHAEGYPGDGAYLEFHKKHYPGGLRYWRVTQSGSALDRKESYVPSLAAERVAAHAVHFAGLLGAIAKENGSAHITAAYDTELFGHWWFEGPAWLEAVIRAVAAGRNLAVETPAQRLHQSGLLASSTLPEGSWGDGGGHSVWLNDETRWTWRLVYDAEDRMARATKMVRSHSDLRGGTAARILREMGRELLLLESSDWQFLITTDAAPDYAERRLRGHYDEFRKLDAMWERAIVEHDLAPEDGAALDELERQPRPFASIADSNWWGEGFQSA